MKTTKEQSFGKWNLLRLFVLICTTTVSTLSSFGQAGNAPMVSLPQFPGPLAIDGFLQRQGANGDWLQAAGGSANNFLFTNEGVPLVPLAFLLTDLFNDQVNDDIFDGGNKLFHDPNTWGWRSQKPPAKDDINKALFWVAVNPDDDHIWAAMAGDRMSTNGTSYIDFEFYQTAIFKTGGPIPGGTGGFTTAGPHGGRTLGDISVTLEFTGGGSLATVKYLQWQPDAEAPGSYNYFEITPDTDSALAAANGDVINVPYGAFGGFTYEPRQFVEGAVDITAIIGTGGFPGECGGLPFETLFIKTKSSAERTADLKDMIAPLQLNVCFDETAPILTCPPTLNLPGCSPSLPPPSGATATDNCDGAVIPVSSDGPVTTTACGRSMNRTWIATDDCGNMTSCIQQINWTVDITAPVISGVGANADLGCNPDNITFSSPTASDACGNTTFNSSTGSDVAGANCSVSRTMTWAASDACGNTATASQTLTWTTDQTPPVFTSPTTPVDLGCFAGAVNLDATLGGASASDACGTPTISISDGNIQLDGCSRSATRTYTATDACGNTATSSRTVTWISDQTAPVISGVGANADLGCNPTDITFSEPTSSDACGNTTLTPVTGDDVAGDNCTVSRTRTWTAVDACGNISTASQTLTWTADETAPVISGVGADADLGCNPTDITFSEPTSSDACGNTTLTPVTGDDVAGDNCTVSRTRTWTAVDACGNISTASQTLTWTADETAPVISGVGADADLGCNPTDITFSEPTSSDACGNTTLTPVTGDDVAGDNCTVSRTRTWTAVDACGNISTASQTLTWTADETAPVISGVGADADLGCNPANITFSEPTSSDACGNTTLTPVTGDDVAGDNCTVSRTRTWTAVDACGNISTASQTLTWTADETAPVISGVGADADLGCNPANITFSEPTSSDACGNTTLTPVTGDDVAGDNCTVSRTRTWTAVDACGNISTASQTLTWTADETAPVISGVGADADLGCNPDNITFSEPTSSDACGNTTLTPVTGDDVAGDNCTVSRTRTWTAVDACGNISTASQTLTWTADETAPVISGVGADADLGCNPANITFSEPTSSDACGNTTLTPVTGDDVAGDNCTVSRTRTWTAVDACGNISTASQTLTWTADETAPVISGVGADADLGCNPANITFSEPTSSDACGNTTLTPVTGDDVAGDNCTVSRTRTWTAVDACGNISTASQTLTWTADETAPVISGVGADADLGCNPTDITFSEPTSSDACGNTTLTPVTGDDVAGDNCTVSRTRTWTAVDACGNISTASQTLTWTADETAPVISGVGANADLGCNPTDITFSEPTSSDACGNTTLTPVTGDDVAGDNCTVSRTRTWTAVDACGNISTASQTLTWTADETAPVISGVGADADLGCNPTDITFSEPTSSDACGNTTLTPVTGDDVAGDNCTVSRTRTWTAVDACGNISTASQTLTWTADETAPVISGVGADADLGCNPTDITFSEPTSSDACGNTTLTPVTGDDVAGDNCTVSRTRTWTAVDACGNISTASQTLTWTADETAPVISGVGADADLGCNPANITFSEPTSSDACGNTTLTPVTGDDVAGDNCTVSRTRTWTAVDACGNISTASQTLTWTADETAPVISGVGADADLGCNPANITFSEPTSSDACGNTTLTPVTGDDVAGDNCTVSRTRTWTAVDACGNISTASQTLTWTADLTPPSFVGAPANVDIECYEEIPAVVNPTATDACGSATVASTGTTDNTLACTLTNSFKRIVTRSWKATDACGNTATYTQTIRVKCCEAICTYTQGAYGNAGGQDCDGDVKMSTTDLIDQSIANWSGNLTIGKPGHSVVIGTGDASCVIAALPGGGPAKELPDGDFDICSLPNSLVNGQGRIRNVLLAQTITLGLNIGITSPSDLGVFPLQAGVLATTDPVGGCGSDIPEERICHYSTTAPYGLLNVENEYTYRTISAAVVNAIPGAKTVAGLFELANRALANVDGVNGSENGASLSDIAGAAGAINEVFDECKIFVGWNVAPCPATDPTPGDGRMMSNTVPVEPALMVTAFPNPYEENFSLRINSPVSGQANIGFYTIDGVKVGELKRDVVANKDVSVPYNVPAVYRTRIVYTVSVGTYNAKGIVLSPN